MPSTEQDEQYAPANCINRWSLNLTPQQRLWMGLLFSIAGKIMMNLAEDSSTHQYNFHHTSVWWRTIEHQAILTDKLQVEF